LNPESLRAARIVAERDPAGQTVVGQRHAAQHIILDEPEVHREAEHSLVPLAVARNVANRQLRVMEPANHGLCPFRCSSTNRATTTRNESESTPMLAPIVAS
jgi:RecB family endonuclease NucS